jgi:hypothetical protein
MDTYEGPAQLEWWANRQTCLSSADVRVRVISDASGWHVSAAFTSPLTGEDREGWAFLRELSPYFTLRFEEDEDAAIDVHVDEPRGDELRLTIA